MYRFVVAALAALFLVAGCSTTNVHHAVEDGKVDVTVTALSMFSTSDSVRDEAEELAKGECGGRWPLQSLEARLTHLLNIPQSNIAKLFGEAAAKEAAKLVREVGKILLRTHFVSGYCPPRTD